MAHILPPASAKSKKLQSPSLSSMKDFLDGYKTYIFLILYALSEIVEKAGWIAPGTGDILKTAFLTGAGISMRGAVKKLE